MNVCAAIVGRVVADLFKTIDDLDHHARTNSGTASAG